MFAPGSFWVTDGWPVSIFAAALGADGAETLPTLSEIV
jgi:hypothetical protein